MCFVVRNLVAGSSVVVSVRYTMLQLVAGVLLLV